jgi:putative ABC transport system ATP-binding protein
MILLENVKKTYKGASYEVEALNDVSLEIAEGEFIAIMGKSGSGKSTLLNVLGCMDTIDSGKYLLDGVTVSELRPHQFDKIRRDKVSFVFQKYELMDMYTVYENIELPLNRRKINRVQKKKAILDIMERLGISDLRDKLPSQISGGEQQRVAIARAYVSNNKYILADEPTGALDEKNTKEIMQIFRSLNSEGKTIIVVTHDDEIAGYADRIIRISDGRII